MNKLNDAIAGAVAHHADPARPKGAAAVAPVPQHTDAQALAEAVGAAMYARDPASRSLGVTLDAIAPGRACMSMAVRADMLNGHATCHGGFIFALADSAFAFACNSRNHVTVGAGCTIDYLSPGREGDLLTATATEQALAGKSGIYDVQVSNQDGRTIALFRGKSHRISGEVI
jgi:acyl-CoA thioesterase